MRTLWILLLSVVLFPACGTDSPPPANNQRPPLEDVLDDLEEDIEQLNALGYLGGVANPVIGKEGITRHDRDKAYQGYNFYVSGHRPEAILMDMEGEVIHSWHHPFAEVIRHVQLAYQDKKPENMDAGAWRKAWLYPNGDLLAIHDSYALIKIDKDSNLLWVYPQGVHHDVQVQEDGTIYAISHEMKRLPEIHPDQPVRDDLIVVLDENGNELRRISIYECLANSDSKHLLRIMPRNGDLFHTNTLRVLDGAFSDSLPEFRKGNVLISLLMESTVAVVDLDAKQIVWDLQGSYRFQHEPHLLANGRILLFDNFGPAMRGLDLFSQPGAAQSTWYSYVFNPKLPTDPASAVLEIDPTNGEVAWSYQGTESDPFSSETCGTAYRLPNGNTLITETQHGRSFEVTATGGIVWEFYSTHRFGDKTARLFDLKRVEESYVEPWL